MMVTDELFKEVCANAKIDILLQSDMHNNIQHFLQHTMSKLDDIVLDENIDLLNLNLTNTYREDVPTTSLSREDVISQAKETYAGCVKITGKIRGDE